MIIVTEKAADKIKQISEEEELNSLTIRAKVIGGGCAGFSYDLTFEDGEPTTMDEVFEVHGVRVIADPLSFQYIDGTIIDFVENTFGGGFKFNNPNVKSTCGCQQSFSV